MASYFDIFQNHCLFFSSQSKPNFIEIRLGKRLRIYRRFQILTTSYLIYNNGFVLFFLLLFFRNVIFYFFCFISVFSLWEGGKKTLTRKVIYRKRFTRHNSQPFQKKKKQLYICIKNCNQWRVKQLDCNNIIALFIVLHHRRCV